MYQLLRLALPATLPSTGYLIFAGSLLLLAGIIRYYLTRSLKYN